MSKTRGFWHHKQKGVDITRLMARDGANCTICGKPIDRTRRGRAHRTDPMRVSFDHIVPRSHGGLSNLANLRLAHGICNSRRGNDPLVEDDEP